MKNEEIETRTTDETITISRAEYEKLLSIKAESEHLENMNRWYEEQLKIIRQKMYGTKAEKASAEVDDQMVLIFDEPEMYAFLEESRRKTIPVAAHERVKKEHVFTLDKIPENAEVEVEEHHLSPEERICPVCGSEMTEIGKDVVRTLKIRPAEFIVHEDQYFTYACRECEKDSGETQIVKTPHAASMYPGSIASPSAVAYLMTQKYVMGTPLYRMEQDFGRQGYSLSRQTMSNWMIHCSEKWLKPLYDELHTRLLKEEILHADETEVQVLREPGKKAESNSYMWLYRTGKYSEHAIVLLEYQDNRRQANPQNFLKGFKGYLQTDGYSGYNSVEDVIHVGCMAHLKRKFHDAVLALPSGKKTGAAVDGEAYCDALFKLEEQFANMSPEERHKNRQLHAKRIMDEFLSWGGTRHAAPKSKLGEALTYLNNQGRTISNYLLDGRLEISNNIAERTIKMFVIDRKNFLFANTPKGAEASAVTFSIIRTAMDNGLDPFKYLEYVFKTAPTLDTNAECWVEPLLPWNVPGSCKT